VPKPSKGPRLASGPSHEKLMLSGLAAALFRDERIRTTEAKAKRLRPVAERLITLGKAGDVSSRRRALAVVEDRDIIHKLFDDIAPRFASRNGGYTRILKLGPRKGDAAPMALIELVEGEVAEEKPSRASEEGRRTRGIRRRRRPAAESAQPVDETEETEDAEPVEETEAVASAQAVQQDEGSEDEPEVQSESPAEAAVVTEEPPPQKLEAQDAAAEAADQDAREAQAGPPQGSDKETKDR